MPPRAVVRLLGADRTNAAPKFSFDIGTNTAFRLDVGTTPQLMAGTGGPTFQFHVVNNPGGPTGNITFPAAKWAALAPATTYYYRLLSWGTGAPLGMGTILSFTPRLEAIEPARGSVEGGTVIELIGLGLGMGGLPSVNVGGQPATNISVGPRGFVQATTPPGSAGSAPIAVRQGGANVSAPGIDFEYHERIFRIHPSIGIARVGDADRSAPNFYFIGPEVPGTHHPGPFKINDRIKPQAARFRVWEYEYDASGKLTPKREITTDDADIQNIEWTVHLANEKAAFAEFAGPAGETTSARPPRNPAPVERWIIDPGPRTVVGGGQRALFVPNSSANPSAEKWPTDPAGARIIEYLGELVTEPNGRLHVVGGKGISRARNSETLGDYANNPGWFDDVSDGPVTATIHVRSNGATRRVPVEDAGKAWVLVGPPDFAPSVPNMVSLYDVLFDLAVRRITIPNNTLYDGALRDLAAELAGTTGGHLSSYRPSYGEHIAPLMSATNKISSVSTWNHIQTNNPAIRDPTVSTPVRGHVFRKLRVPQGFSGSGGNMPACLGDNPYASASSTPEYERRLTVTPTQYALLKRWADGAFTAGGAVPNADPHGLDRAALENASGGAFYPGIEVGWLIRAPSIFIEPFRIRHGAPGTHRADAASGATVRAGYFSRQMALPWQADFIACQQEGGGAWWPSQRPDRVLVGSTKQDWARNVSGYQGMVDHWSKLGFVVAVSGVDSETERKAGF
ncbi:MAG: LodA/GoxA family CTQ-dependent oxidase [Deltaproteobacteria bacterium]